MQQQQQQQQQQTVSTLSTIEQYHQHQQHHQSVSLVAYQNPGLLQQQSSVLLLPNQNQVGALQKHQMDVLGNYNSNNNINNTNNNSTFIPNHILLEELTTTTIIDDNNTNTDSKMLKSTNNNTKKRKFVPPVLDRHLQNDYLSKRYRAIQEVKMYERYEEEIKKQQQQQVKQQQLKQQQQQQQNQKLKLLNVTNTKVDEMNNNNNTNNSTNVTSSNVNSKNSNITLADITVEDDDPFWNGASSLEKALVSCCRSSDHNKTTSSIKGQNQNEISNNSNKVATIRSHHHNDPDSDDTPGVLARDKIATFVGLLTRYCHDIASRSLALAILEVTQEMDEHDLDYQQQREQQYNEEDDDTPVDDTNISNTDTTSEVATSDEKNEQECKVEKPIIVVKRMSPDYVRPRQEYIPSRLMIFMKAGGIKILSRWLYESAKPKEVVIVETNTKKKAKQQQSGTNTTTPKRTKLIPSATGRIMIPLIQFLQKIPIDEVTIDVIKTTDMIDVIKQIRKCMNLIIETEMSDTEDITALSDSIREERTDPLSGGLPVIDVHKEVNMLIEIWDMKRKKISQIKKTQSQPPVKYKESTDPFQHIRSAIANRLKVLSEYEGLDSRISKNTTISNANNANSKSNNPKPDWLKRYIQLRKNKEEAMKQDSNKKPLTVQERERLEHEMERKRREEILKRDTMNLMKSKQENEKRVREMEERKLERQRLLREARERDAAIQKSNKPKPLLLKSEKQRKVRWKDGFTFSSIKGEINAKLLEEVFIIPRGEK